LIAKSPNRAEPHIDLGYLELRQRQTGEAREHFAKAFELGSRDSRMLWDYGRMVESADLSKSKQALGELLKQEPDRLEVRLELASVELRAHAAKEALETLAPVKKVTAADAPKLLTLVAYANLDAGDREMARNAAIQLKAVSTSIEDRDRADKILEFLAGPRPDAVKPALGSGELDSPPVLKHRDTTVKPAPPVVRRASFAGQFVELHCPEGSGERARIVMETAEGRKLLAIDDPAKLSVNGNSGQTMELSCGPQKRARIRIEYDPPGANLTGVDGVARVISFDP
jgi:tetratricopeptide (TPR) repeat protein